jgi:exodeoxyribonuclease VII small subunit
MKKTEKASFEERLSRLEELGEAIRDTSLPLDSALKHFEEGLGLAKGLEAELAEAEGRIEILMNPSTERPPAAEPEMELFSGV